MKDSSFFRFGFRAFRGVNSFLKWFLHHFKKLATGGPDPKVSTFWMLGKVTLGDN